MKTCCDPSLEPSGQDGSNDGSQNMILWRNIANYPLIIPVTPSYLEHYWATSSWSALFANSDILIFQALSVKGANAYQIFVEINDVNCTNFCVTKYL